MSILHFAAEVTLTAIWHFCSRSYPGCRMAFLQQKLPWLPYGIFAAEVTLAAVWHFCSGGEPGRSQQFPGVCGHPGAVPAARTLHPHHQLVLHHAATVRGNTFSTLWGGTPLIARPHSQVLRAGTDAGTDSTRTLSTKYHVICACLHTELASVSEWVFHGKFYALSKQVFQSGCFVYRKLHAHWASQRFWVGVS